MWLLDRQMVSYIIDQATIQFSLRKPKPPEPELLVFWNATMPHRSCCKHLLFQASGNKTQRHTKLLRNRQIMSILQEP